jgi:hypothetical protein
MSVPAARSPFLAPLLVLAVLAAPAPASAAPIAPGMEHVVGRLVGAAELRDGWKTGSIRITPASIEVVLDGPSQQQALVVLRAPGDVDERGERLGSTKSFEARLIARDDAPKPSARLLLQQIGERDDGTFFAQVDALAATIPELKDADATSRPTQARVLGPLDDARRALSYLALLALLAGLALTAKERPRRRIALIGGLFVLALAVRLVVPHRAPMHSNGHGIAELRGLAGSTGFGAFIPETDRYGVAQRQVVRALIGPFHGGANAALLASAVFGALGAVALFALAMLLFSSVSGALAAALLYALSPAQAWLSVSESPMALAGLLFLLGLAAAVAALEADLSPRRAHALAFVAMLALGNASELAVTTLAMPVAGLLFLLVACSDRLHFQSFRRFAAPLAVLAVTVGLHLYALGPVLAEARRQRGQEAPLALRHFLGPGNLLANLPLTAGLGLFALAGLLVMLRGHRRVALGIVLGTAILLFSGAFVLASLTDELRYQVAGMLLIFLAPAGLGLLPRFASAVALAAVAAASLPGLLFVRAHPPLEAVAYEAVARAAAALPAEVVVKLAPRRMGRVIAEFPEFLLQPEHRLTIDEAGPPGAACYVYVGPACWSFTPDEVRDGVPARAPHFAGEPIRPDCSKLVNGVESAGPGVFAGSSEVPWRDGEFHRIVARRPAVGLFPCAK